MKLDMKIVANMKKIIAIFSLLVSCVAFANGNHTLKGTVKDSKGEPVIGAVIMLEGNSSVGTVSDAEGRYTLIIPSEKVSKGKITVSCLSYISQTHSINSRTVIDFVLEDDNEQLDEVVVVGYGSMRKSDLTGSVASVKMNDIEASQSASLNQLLQGRAAGVQVTSNSASPDGGVSVLIRGASSFNSSSEPLYVVDGIIINTSGSSSLMSSNLGGDNAGSDEQTNGLMGINPMDIASIEILKDASATAIYGSQGANGVVLITTKSASREKPVINASIGIDISQRYKKMPMMNFEEYGNFLREMIDSPLVKQYNPDLVNVALSRLNVLRSDTFSDNYEPIDWQDYLMRTAVSQRYYVSIAGKPRNSNYMFSIGYNSTEGIVKTTGFQNLTVRLNFEQKFSNIVTLGTKSGISYLDSQLTQGASTGRLSAASSMMRSMLTCSPIVRLNKVDDDGDIIDFGDDENQQYSPNRWMNGFVNNKIEYRINPSLYLQVMIQPWLQFKTTIGCDYRATEQNKFKSKLLTSDASGSSAAISHIDRLAWNWDNVFMVNKRFNKRNSISGSLGMSMSRSSTTTHLTEGANIEQWKAFDKSINGAAYAFQTYSEASFSLMSFYARAVYNYADRYVLTATFRADGSSRFADGNKWGYFPSFAAAWRLNNEPWFRIPAVSMAKFRVGWGQVGNQSINSYATISNYTTSYYPDHSSDSHLALGTSTNNLPNANLKWETTEQTNVGLDLGFFKGRLTLTLDAYYKLTRDLLQTKTLAPSAGLQNPFVNMGSISNKGLEITLDATPVATTDFEWSIGGNISFNRNRIISINPSSMEKDWIYLKEGDRQFVSYFKGDDIGNGSVLKSYLNVFVEGQPMGLFYGLKTDGLVKPGETGLPYSASDTSYRGPGSINYVDIDGDGFITEMDRVIIGDPNPDFTYGFNTSFRYKRFTLSAQFVGSYGNDIYNVNKLLDTNTTGAFQNVCRDVITRQWTETNTDTWYPALGALNAQDVKWATDRYVEDGSYLRLANLTLAYDIPIRKCFIKNINISATGSNLVFWTRYSGWDPDVNSYGTVKKKGADMGSYPGARMYKIDLRFTF